MITLRGRGRRSRINKEQLEQDVFEFLRMYNCGLATVARELHHSKEIISPIYYKFLRERHKK